MYCVSSSEIYDRVHQLAKEEKEADIFHHAERTATIISTVAVANLLLGVVRVLK